MRGAAAVVALLACAAPAAGGDPAAGDREGAWWAGGRADLRYAFRSTGGGAPEGRETDQDLTEDLFLEGGRTGALRFEASGRVREDLDGRPRVSVFRDVYDAGGSPVRTFLYTGFADVLDAGPAARIRLGRQYYGEGVDVRFDGGLVETAETAGGLRLVAYGGVPVHLFEASARGDWLAGGAVALAAGDGAAVRLDYAHVTDARRDLERAERRDGVPRDARRDDDYFQVAATFRPARELRIRAQGSTFEGRSSRLEAEAILVDPDLDLSGRLRYTLQAGAYRDLSIQFTPLDEVLGDYEPYHEVHAQLRKELAERFGLGAGLAVRELRDDGEEGPFNHEFRRYFVLADAAGWPWDGLEASVLAELYRSDAARRTYQVSGEVAQEAGAFTVSLGTSFALFRFDETFLEERERVRSYWSAVEWRPAKGVRPRVAYAFERDDEDEYHAVRFDLRIAF